MHLFWQVGHDKAQSVAQCYSPPSTEQFRNPAPSGDWTGGDWLSCCSRTDLREDRWTPEINTIFISPDNNFSIRSYLSIREAFKNKISSIDFWIFFIFKAFTKHFYIASSIFLGWWWKPPKCQTFFWKASAKFKFCSDPQQANIIFYESIIMWWLFSAGIDRIAKQGQSKSQ